MTEVAPTEKQHVSQEEQRVKQFATMFTRSIRFQWKIVPSVSNLCGMAGSTLSAPFSVVVLTSVIPVMLPTIFQNAHSVDQNSVNCCCVVLR
jgi:hypothetical protein